MQYTIGTQTFAYGERVVVGSRCANVALRGQTGDVTGTTKSRPRHFVVHLDDGRTIAFRPTALEKPGKRR